jgi:hypothetical protein
LPLTFASEGVVDRALARAMDLFASSTSDKEIVPDEPRRKHPRSSPPPRAISKPSDTSDVEGTTICDVYFLFI